MARKIVTLDNLEHFYGKLKDQSDVFVDVLNQSISSKQDKIDNIVIAEDVNEELDDVEANTYVKYVAQTLTEEQKSQVRNNIGVNLTDYAKTEDLTDYVKTEDLTDYVKTEDLTDYAKIGDLSGYKKTEELSNVATSGSYNDLINKPTILSESDVNNLIDTKIGDINSILETIINGN